MIIKLLLMLSGFVGSVLGYKAKDNWLELIVIINMLFIPLLGARMIDLFGLVSNIGNIFYATAITGFALLLFKHGRMAAYKCLARVLLCFSYLFLFAYLIGQLDVLPRDEITAASQNTLFDFGFRVMIASYGAMMVAVGSFIYLLDKFRLNHPVFAYALLIIPVQIIDSAVFFPIAFSGTDLDLFSIAWEGTVIKIIVGVISIPIIYALLRTSPPQTGN